MSGIVLSNGDRMLSQTVKVSALMNLLLHPISELGRDLRDWRYNGRRNTRQQIEARTWSDKSVCPSQPIRPWTGSCYCKMRMMIKIKVTFLTVCWQEKNEAVCYHWQSPGQRDIIRGMFYFLKKRRKKEMGKGGREDYL